MSSGELGRGCPGLPLTTIPGTKERAHGRHPPPPERPGAHFLPRPTGVWQERRILFLRQIAHQNQERFLDVNLPETLQQRVRVVAEQILHRLHLIPM